MAKVFVFAAPSGAGKSTLANEAVKRLENDYNISQTITYTTRLPREGEVNSKDYHFVSVENFKQKQKDGFFLETTEYRGCFYGSPISILNDLELGKSFIIVTNIEGVKNISKLTKKPVLIWITTPTIEELKRRLLKRGALTQHQLEESLKQSEEEIKEAHKSRLFDYNVVNDVFEDTVDQLVLLIKEKLD